MNHRFEPKQPGYLLKASDVNDIQDAIERLDARAFGDEGFSVGTFDAHASSKEAGLIMARMLTEFVDVEQWIVSQPGDSVPALNNAIEQVWDDGTQAWVDLPGGEFVADFPYKQGVDQNVPFPCVLLSGRWVGSYQCPVRLAVTCAIPDGPGDGGSGPTEGSGESGGGEPWYPDQADDPTVYGITFVTLPYPSSPARWLVTPDGEDADPDAGVVPSEMSVPPGPHATVMNLEQVPGNYLPEGTLVSCFQVGLRWFTRAFAPGLLLPSIFPARLTGVEDPGTFSAAVTSGSAELSDIEDTSFYPAGTPISGLGIPVGATVLAVTSETTLVLSDNATATSISASLAASGIPKRYTFVEQQTSSGGVYSEKPAGRTGSRSLALNDPIIDVMSQPLVWMRPFFEADDAPFTISADATSGVAGLEDVSPNTNAVRVGFSLTGPGFTDGTTVLEIAGDALVTADPSTADSSAADYLVTPRPRRVLNYDFQWSEGQAAAQSSYCDLARLQKEDCLLAAGPLNSVVLSYDESSNKWTGADELEYGSSGGTATFWNDSGRLRMSLTVAASSGSGVATVKDLDLVFCPGTDSFVGGQLTGHLPDTGNACGGSSFSVSLSCVPCPTPGIATTCCPSEETPAVVYAAVTGGGPCDGTYVLTWSPVRGQWDVVCSLGPCPPTITLFGPEYTFAFACSADGDGWILNMDHVPPPSMRATGCLPLTFTTPGGPLDGGTSTCPDCTSPMTITITATNPSGGEGGGDTSGYVTGCASGDCGDAGVAGTLTASFTGTSSGSFTMSCNDHGGAGYHGWQSTSQTFGSHSGIVDIEQTSAPGVYPGTNYAPGLSIPGGFATRPRAGWTCDPFSAVYDVSNSDGSWTITVSS